MYDESKKEPKLFLASTSPYRAEMLAKCGLSFSQLDPEYLEEIDQNESPEVSARRLACGKAENLLALLLDSGANQTQTDKDSPWVIVGSDQIASLKGTILGKPGTVPRAIAQLNACSRQWVSFYTGLHVIYYVGPNTKPVETNYIEEFRVKFRELTETEIENYVALDQPLDCAGSFKAEGLGLTLFDEMRGQDIHTLYGLPLLQLLKVLRQHGINPIKQL